MLNKIYKGLILTVGAQAEQVKFSIKNINPQCLGILGTNTPQCKKAIENIFEEIKIKPTCIKIEYVEDNPGKIKEIITKFYEVYNWLKNQNIKDKEIIVDPTGGRKWMSAGLIMITSFIGLDLIYVDVPFVNGKPDGTKMNLVKIENAYEQVGFLEESKADKLFNNYNFAEASNIYKFLEEKISDPRKISIKKLISEAYFNWTNFRFKDAFNFLESALKKIEQFGFLNEHKIRLESQIKILKILKENDESEVSYFNLIKKSDFSEKILLFLFAQSERYEKNKDYNLATILLYRILEAIAQIRLAQRHDIDTNKIKEEIKKNYNEEFKKITKEIFGGESEMPDRIALIHSWILLYCLKDDLVKKENIKFLNGMREQVKIRDLLWIEHRNKTVEENDYIKFKRYCEMWLSKVRPDFKEKLCDYIYIKF